jgi:hypothetical protein
MVIQEPYIINISTALEISGSHGGEYEDYSVLEYTAV